MSPPLLLSALVAGLIGLTAHAALGRRLWQLPLYLLAAFVGVFAAEVVAALTGGGLLRYGSVPLGSALIGGGGAALFAWLLMMRAVLGGGADGEMREGRNGGARPDA